MPHRYFFIIIPLCIFIVVAGCVNGGKKESTRVSMKARRYLSELKKNDPFIRVYAADGLGTLKCKCAVPALLKALADPFPNVRLAAAQALGAIKSETAVQGLILAAEKDEDSYVRAEAVEALGLIGSQVAMQLIIDLTKDSDGLVRRSAVRALGFYNNKKLISLLLVFLKDNDWRIRKMSIYSLRHYFHNKAVTLAIAKALKDEAVAVRREAAWVLSNAKDKRVIVNLIDALSDEDDEVRFATVSALHKLTSIITFGADVIKWREWWEKNKARILKEEAAEEK